MICLGINETAHIGISSVNVVWTDVIDKRFLLNKNTGEIHDLTRETELCSIEEAEWKSKAADASTGEEVRHAEELKGSPPEGGPDTAADGG